jgi:hypothetical protein
VELSRIDRQYVDIDVAATLADGTPATLAGIDVALLPPRVSPTATTTWAPAAYASGTATVLLAGPDASSTDALVVPLGGADLWLRAVDNPEVTARRITRVSVV